MTQSPRDLAVQRIQLEREQERFLQDLLGILDALDHACHHWQQAESAHTQSSISLQPVKIQAASGTSNMGFQQWKRSLQMWWKQQFSATASSVTMDTTDEVGEVLTNAREGMEMIQRSLLEVLRKRQVVPLNAQGQAFNPELMYALGSQECHNIPDNMVVQEVVRGYLWQNRVLREAQVIVAKQPSDPDISSI